MTRAIALSVAFVLFGGVACTQAPQRSRTAPAPHSLSPDEEASVVAAGTQLFTLGSAQVPVCVQLSDSTLRYDLTPSVLRRLGSRARRMDNCPPTYTSMFITPETAKRPAGYVDPYHLEIGWPRPSVGGFTITAALWQGTAFTRYRCEVRRAPSAPGVACVITGQGVS